MNITENEEFQDIASTEAAKAGVVYSENGVSEEDCDLLIENLVTGQCSGAKIAQEILYKHYMEFDMWKMQKLQEEDLELQNERWGYYDDGFEGKVYTSDELYQYWLKEVKGGK